jgi:hypothetical protein
VVAGKPARQVHRGAAIEPPGPAPAASAEPTGRDHRLRSSPRDDNPRPRRDPEPLPVASAAVIGRPGDAEPVAAAIALTLRRLARARAAAVVVVGDGEPEPGGGATPGARKLAARLAAGGFEAVERGRLIRVRVSATATADGAAPEHHGAADGPATGHRAAADGAATEHHAVAGRAAADPARFTAAAACAALAGAPAVLAITAPLTPALEDAIAQQDIAVVVTDDEAGPLAELAVASLARPDLIVVIARPLPRGPARALARAGIAAPRAVRDLVERALGPPLSRRRWSSFGFRSSFAGR